MTGYYLGLGCNCMLMFGGLMRADPLPSSLLIFMTAAGPFAVRMSGLGRTQSEKTRETTGSDFQTHDHSHRF